MRAVKRHRLLTARRLKVGLKGVTLGGNFQFRFGLGGHLRLRVCAAVDLVALCSTGFARRLMFELTEWTGGGTVAGGMGARTFRFSTGR